MKRVFIIGGGQIGSRHLQALKKVNFPLSITVIDSSPKSLKMAQERYNSLPEGQYTHSVEYALKIPKNTTLCDLAIVATCSDVRSKMTKELLSSVKVRYLILEKILFDKKSDYDSIDKMIRQSKTKTWVNCPMRMMPTYQNIEKHFRDKRISYIVTGSKLGLVTNAIHYLDHVCHLSDTTKFEVNTEGLDRKTIPSKRKGFLELTGTLTANFPNGSNISISSYPQGDAPVVVEIHSDSAKYMGWELAGRAWLANADNEWQWQELEAPITLQSQLTTILAEKILNTGNCELVSYSESRKIHLQMLEPLLKFLNKNNKKKYNRYPFT